MHSIPRLQQRHHLVQQRHEERAVALVIRIVLMQQIALPLLRGVHEEAVGDEDEVAFRAVMELPAMGAGTPMEKQTSILRTAQPTCRHASTSPEFRDWEEAVSFSASGYESFGETPLSHMDNCGR
jgi:hypothetical protein